MSLIHVPKRHFTILPYRLMKRAEYTFEPVLDFYARKFRKMALDHSILEKQRLLIPANRSRKPEDTLVRLKQSHETAGAILPRDEFPELDFVLDQRQGYTLRRVPHYNVQNYYVRIPETGELVRVTINNLEFQPGFAFFIHLFFIQYLADENWIPWIHFNRYIVGRPNLLYIPIKIRKGFSNPTLTIGGNLYQKIMGLYVK